MPAKRNQSRKNKNPKSSKRRKTDANSTADVREETEDLVSKKEMMLTDMKAVGFDGSDFASHLETSVVDRLEKRGKPPRMVRYYHYCGWAHALLRKNIGPEDAEYGFPAQILSFIRDIAPGNIKGEIREDAYSVTLEVFCDALDLPKL